VCDAWGMTLLVGVCVCMCGIRRRECFRRSARSQTLSVIVFLAVWVVCVSVCSGGRMPRTVR
jgi:Ca2+/H+ antiporter